MLFKNKCLVLLILISGFSTISRSMEKIDKNEYAQSLLCDDLYYVKNKIKLRAFQEIKNYKFSSFRKSIDTIKPEKLKNVDAKKRYKLFAYDDGYGIDTKSKSAMEIAKKLRLYELEQDLKNFNLIHAIEENNTVLVNKYINEGAEVDWIFAGESALFCACRCGLTKIAKILLNNGARVNLALENSMATPLRIAIFNNRLGVLKLLLASVDIKTENAISLAAYENNFSAVKLLVQSGVRPSQKDIFTAILKADVKLLHYLLKNTTYNISSVLSNDTFYENALKSDRFMMAKYLLFISDLFKAIEGSMLFNDFAQKHFIEEDRFLSTQKLLYLDEKGDFSKKFCDWEKENSLLKKREILWLQPKTSLIILWNK